MTQSDKIRLFYILSIAGAVIGFLTSFLLLGKLSTDDYGIYTIYITFVSQLGILSFGFQDGMLINYRKKEHDKVLPLLYRDIKFGYLFQMIILIITIILIPITMKYLFNLPNENIVILILAIISIFPASILGNFRNAFSALGEFKKTGYIDFYSKVYLLISVLILIIFNLDVYTYMILDIIFKTFIIIYLTINLKKEIERKQIKQYEKTEYKFKVVDNFKKGLYILLGNWAFIFVFTMDRSFLSVDPAILGLYAQSFFLLMILFQIFLPIKSVLFTTINEKMSEKEIIKIIKKICLVGYLLVALYAFVGYPIIETIIINMKEATDNLDMIFKLDGYNEAFKLSRLITMILPMYFSIQMVLNNLIMLKRHRTYTIIGIVNLLISFVIYYSLIKLTNLDLLYAIVFGTIVNYIISFILNMVCLVSLKYSIYFFLQFLLSGLIYIVSLEYTILRPFVIIGLLVMVIYELKKRVE